MILQNVKKYLPNKLFTSQMTEFYILGLVYETKNVMGVILQY